MRKLWLFFLVIAYLPATAQFEPIYTQYSMNQAIFNPAYSVVNNVMSVSLMSRKQWVGLEGAPFTNTLVGTTTFFRNRGGAGLILHSNTYGITTNLEVFVQAAYKIPIGINSQFSVGIQGGYLDYRNDFTKVEQAALDPSFGNVVEKMSVPNFGVGVFYNTNNFYIGLSIPKFMEYNTDKSGSPTLVYNRHYYASVGAVLPMGLLKLKTTGLLRYNKNDISYDLGASLLLAETIWAGIFTRNFNAFGAMGMFELTDRLKLGLTAELPSTELVTNQYGSYEIFFSWELAVIKRQLLKRRYF